VTGVTAVQRWLRSFLRQWRIALRITRMNARARLAYRGDAVTSIAFGIAWQSSVLVFATVLLSRFPGLGGWTSGGVVLIFGIRLLCHGVYGVVFQSLLQIPFLLEQGYFDGYLVRPMPVYRQVLLVMFPISALGEVLSGLFLFAIAIARAHLHWTPLMALYLVAALIGGVLLEAAVQTVLAAQAFNHSVPFAVYMWFDRMIQTFGNYPFSIFPLAVRALMTYVLPIAFIAYLPAAVLTGRVAATGMPAWLVYASPAVGPLLYVLARYGWYRGLQRYESAGG
jgi:ABC-2 type transport system permease protein